MYLYSRSVASRSVASKSVALFKVGRSVQCRFGSLQGRFVPTSPSFFGLLGASRWVCGLEKEPNPPPLTAEAPTRADVYSINSNNSSSSSSKRFLYL